MTTINKINFNETEYTVGGSQDSIPTEVKRAMDTLFQNMAVKDNAVYSDEFATFHAWATAINLLSISAVFNQGTTVIYDTDSLDDLKQYLTVTASYDDESTATITGYTLSGTLTEGTSTITVAYEGKTATFTVTVTENVPQYPLETGSLQQTTARSIAVSDGNHIVYANTSSATSGQGYYGDVSRVSRNSGAGTSNAIFSGASTLFTIPNGATVEIKLKVNSISKLTSAISTVALYGTGLNTIGVWGVQFGNTEDTEVTLTETASSDMTIEVVGLYARNSVTNVDLEYTLTVNGVRYI